jgi:hypothetical protein
LGLNLSGSCRSGKAGAVDAEWTGCIGRAVKCGVHAVAASKMPSLRRRSHADITVRARATTVRRHADCLGTRLSPRR